MKRKIEKLTDQQERDLVSVRDAMWQQGVSCEPANRAEAEAAISDAYREIGRKPPRFFWMSSPMTCVLALYVLRKAAGLWDGLRAGLGAGLGAGLRAGLWDDLGAGLWDGLRDGLRDDLGGAYWLGQMDAYWLAYYRFGTDLGCAQKEEHLRRLKIMERIATSCGVWYPRDGICIVSDRFLSVRWDEARNLQGLPFRLHADRGPAVQFRDQWALYYWHGLRLDPAHEWILREPENITKDAILSETNSELRRVMCEIIGWPRAIELLGGKTIATDELHGQPRELIDISLGNGEVARVIKLINGTIEADGTRHVFIEGVPNEVATPHDAVAWQYGISSGWYREGVRT